MNVKGSVLENAIWSYPDPLEGCVDTRGYVAFYWNKMDAWFEEDEEVFVHARDPYKRIDCLRTSRVVEIMLNGETIAKTDNSIMLVETGMPVRYYIPACDIYRELLVQSELVTRCPYKGEAHYYSVLVGGKSYKDIAWYYRYPLPEVSKIANNICFPQEKVTMYIDGECVV